MQKRDMDAHAEFWVLVENYLVGCDRARRR